MRLLDRMPLFALADVFIVTSPRDGLNRMPLEFVAAQAATRGGGAGGSGASSRKSSMLDMAGTAGAAEGKLASGMGAGGSPGKQRPPQGEKEEEEPAAEEPPPPPAPGVLILSEFVSCTRVLLGAMFVNPWKIEDTTELLHKALAMSREERVLRHTRDVGFVNSQTVLNWAYQVGRCLSACLHGSTGVWGVVSRAHVRGE